MAQAPRFPYEPTSLRTELRRHVIERRIGVGADRLDRRQTDDHDQGQHHRVFNGGWAIFGREETLHLQSERFHVNPPFLLVAPGHESRCHRNRGEPVAKAGHSRRPSIDDIPTRSQ